MYYIGRRHTATRVENVRAQIDCPSCGIVEVRAAGTGTGSGSAPFFFGGDSARSTAHSTAIVNARRDARQMLEVGWCPKCRTRTPRAVARLRWEMLAALVAAGAILGAGAHFGQSILTYGPLGFVLFFMAITARAWFIAPRRVVLVTPEELAEEAHEMAVADTKKKLAAEPVDAQRERRRARADAVRKRREAREAEE